MLYRDCFALAHCVSLYILSVVIIHTYYQRSQHLAGLSGMALPRWDFDDSGSTTVLPGALIMVNVTTSSQLTPTLLGIVVLFLHYYFTVQVLLLAIITVDHAKVT